MKNEELVIDNMGLVKHIALRYQNAGYDLDDLIQEGSIGLIAAAEKFNPDLGYCFSTLAGRCIESKILMYLRSQKKHRRCAMSLNQEMSEDGRRLEEVLGFWPEAFEYAWKRDYLEKAIGALNREERELIRRYYLDGTGQVELGRWYGVSQAQMSRRLKRILEKMRRAAG